MKCSLIISVYKNTRFLDCVLRSLDYQTEQDFEVIISEDGDSSEMRTYLDAYHSPRPLTHLTQPDVGWRKNQALNNAVRAAKSDQLVFIDGDCVLHPRFIEMHVRHYAPDVILAGKRVMLNQSLSDQLIATPSQVLHMQPRILSSLLFKRGVERPEEGIFLSPDGPLGFIPRGRKQEYLLGSNMSFSRQAIEHINGFDEDYQKPAFGEDADLAWRFHMAGYRFQSLRNMAVEYHLWHQKGWSDQSEQMAMGAAKRQRGEYICKNGLRKE